MSSIFISYRRSDAPAHARGIYDRLVDRFGEADVFKDIDSTDPGADFHEVIEDTVARCGALIAVIGRDWLPPKRDGERWPEHPRDWVRFEIANALKLGIRVVPVLVEGASMPSPADLPDDLHALTRRQNVELGETAWTAQLDQLINALGNILPPQAEPESRPEPQAELQMLRIKTGCEGAAAKAGHDLVLDVADWEVTVSTGDSPSIELTVDPTSIEVVSGSGGAKPLSDRDNADIKKSISKVLGTSPITFTSSHVQMGRTTLAVEGELTIAGKGNFINVPLAIAANGAVRGSITLIQSNFGIKPFTAMLGALKVNDSVEILIEGRLSQTNGARASGHVVKTTRDHDNRSIADRAIAKLGAAPVAHMPSHGVASASARLARGSQPISPVIPPAAPYDIAQLRDAAAQNASPSPLRRAALVIYRHPIRTMTIPWFVLVVIGAITDSNSAVLIAPWSVLLLTNVGVLIAKVAQRAVRRSRRGGD
jgi:hypothetical protein